MVTGSVASSIHGIPRSTNDLDIVIAPSRDQLFALIQTFKRLGYYAEWRDAEHALQNRDQFNIIDFPNAWKVDLHRTQGSRIQRIGVSLGATGLMTFSLPSWNG